MSTNEEMVEEFVATRGLSKASHKSFKYTLKHYCNFQGCSLQELIDEADFEEEQQIRWKKRKLKKRLVNYMNFCKDTLTINSAKHHLKLVKIFYHHHDIEIHKLPPFNEKNAKVRNPITPKDLPTREILQEAVEIAEPLMKALILFLVSSGMSKIDARNLTIQNFLDATSKYHNDSKDLKTAIKLMKEYDGEIIPIWNSRRQKTKKFFVTFNTDEATRHIISYLELRDERLKNNYYNPKDELEPSDKLFKISTDYFTLKFKELNNALGLGTAGGNPEENIKGFNRLRAHMLRKYHATNLKKFGMDTYSINVLQGKSNGSVNDVYFFEDEETLLEEYIKAIEGVLILTDVKEHNRYSPEFIKMEKENEEYKEKIDRITDEINSLKKMYRGEA
jgi:integrase